MTTQPSFDPDGPQPFQPSTPFALQRAALRIVQSYGSTLGLCDPQYIANVIAHELGLGDGMGTFREDGWPDECSHRWASGPNGTPRLDRPTTESNADCPDCRWLHRVQMAVWQQTAGKARVRT